MLISKLQQCFSNFLIFILLSLCLFACGSDKTGCSFSEESDANISSYPLSRYTSSLSGLKQTQFVSWWEDIKYYTEGSKPIELEISGGFDPHGDGSVRRPCNICYKIVKYDSSNKITYQTPKCICGPQINNKIWQRYKNQVFQVPRSESISADGFARIETMLPKCQVVPEYEDKDHYDKSYSSSRSNCTFASNSFFDQIKRSVGSDLGDMAYGYTDVISGNIFNNFKDSPEQYNCIPIQAALNLDNGVNHPNFLYKTNPTDTDIANSWLKDFLPIKELKSTYNNHFIENGSYYTRATHLLTANLKNVKACYNNSCDASKSGPQSGFEIVSFPSNYYNQNLDNSATTPEGRLNIKDVSADTENCKLSNGFGLYLNIYNDQDLSSTSNNLAYHLNSFRHYCKTASCITAVQTQYKLNNFNQVIGNTCYYDTGYGKCTNNIPVDNQARFKIYDAYYEDNNRAMGYDITIKSGLKIGKNQSVEGSTDQGQIINDIPFAKTVSAIDDDGIKNTASSMATIDKVPLKVVEKIYTQFTKKGTFINFAIKLVMSLAIIFYAVSYLIGLSEFNKKEIVVLLVKISFISAFLLSSNAWQYYATFVVSVLINGIYELNKLVVSQMIPVLQFESGDAYKIINDIDKHTINFAYIDKIVYMIMNQKTAQLFFAKIFSEMVIGALIFALMIYFLSKTLLRAIMLFGLSWLQIFLALATGPIFFIALLFARTKELFRKWLAFIVSRGLEIVLLMLFTAPFFHIIFQKLSEMYDISMCKIAIGPSFARILIPFVQSDNVKVPFFQTITNSFSICFVAYIISVLMTLASNIATRLITIDDIQNTNIAQQNNAAARQSANYLSRIAFGGMVFAKNSYVGRLIIGKMKGSAYYAYNGFGAKRFTDFMKSKASNIATSAKKMISSIPDKSAPAALYTLKAIDKGRESIDGTSYLKNIDTSKSIPVASSADVYDASSNISQELIEGKKISTPKTLIPIIASAPGSVKGSAHENIGAVKDFMLDETHSVSSRDTQLSSPPKTIGTSKSIPVASSKISIPFISPVGGSADQDTGAGVMRLLGPDAELSKPSSKTLRTDSVHKATPPSAQDPFSQYIKFERKGDAVMTPQMLEKLQQIKSQKTPNDYQIFLEQTQFGQLQQYFATIKNYATSLSVKESKKIQKLDEKFKKIQDLINQNTEFAANVEESKLKITREDLQYVKEISQLLITSESSQQSLSSPEVQVKDDKSNEKILQQIRENIEKLELQRSQQSLDQRKTGKGESAKKDAAEAPYHGNEPKDDEADKEKARSKQSREDDANWQQRFQELLYQARIQDEEKRKREEEEKKLADYIKSRGENTYKFTEIFKQQDEFIISSPSSKVQVKADKSKDDEADKEKARSKQSREDDANWQQRFQYLLDRKRIQDEEEEEKRKREEEEKELAMLLASHFLQLAEDQQKQLADYIKSRGKISLTEEQAQEIIVNQSLKDITDKKFTEIFEKYQQKYEQKDKQQDQSQEGLIKSAKPNPQDSLLKNIFMECFGINKDALDRMNELFSAGIDDGLYSEEKLLKASLRLAEKQEKILKNMLRYQEAESKHLEDSSLTYDVQATKAEEKRIQKQLSSLKSFVEKLNRRLS